MLLASPSNDFGIDEWKLARQVFEKFDDRQHDLRKYGFTFLSALIAADSLTKLVMDADDRIRLSVVGITLLLTVALNLLDKNYELFMSAAAIRAKILEVRLNLELTETISFRHKWDKFDRYVLGVYVMFAAVAGLVGIVVLYPEVLLMGLAAAFTIIAVIAVLAIHRLKPNLKRVVDWSFDRITCAQGEKVRIVATNLSPSDYAIFVENTKAWEIRKEGDEHPFKPAMGKVSTKIEIPPGNNYSWELPTDDFQPGIYRIFPYHATLSTEKDKSKVTPSTAKNTRWSAPLKRAILISKPKPPEKPPQKDN